MLQEAVLLILDPNPLSNSQYAGPLMLHRPLVTVIQLQYHLYAPIGPHSQNILGYQRNVHDLFLPNDFREELQKKAAATLQILPSKRAKA